ncbi:MAG TPA: CAP domain-containing protein [Gammaproteobacteria bacterium]|nr:CAP domain-containing protein [Gammaproteobacteria bacterium]
MKTRFPATGHRFTAPVPVLHVSALQPLNIACVCILAALLAACGGSSGSTVSNSTLTQNNTGSLQAPPASAPGTPPPPTGNASYNLGSTPQTAIEQCMSDEDKEMLTRVNDARSRARDCDGVNYPATAALSWVCTLEDVAYEHSRDMGDYNFFSHTGSDGLTAAERTTNAGYNWSAVGENIAAGQQTITAVMTAWLDSPGHCATIMRSSYTELGAASHIVTGSDYPIYWTQVFARPQ